METALPVCRDMTELATDYLEGALGGGKRFAVRWHLSLCSMCRRHYRQVRQTVALVRRVPAVAPSRAVEDEVIARIDPPGAPITPRLE